MGLKVKVGDLVAFNLLKDATWFRVDAIEGFTLTIREHGIGNNVVAQYMDKTLVKRVKTP